MRDRQVLIADEDAVRAAAQMQAEEVARRVAASPACPGGQSRGAGQAGQDGADPVHEGMALLEAMGAGRL